MGRSKNREDAFKLLYSLQLIKENDTKEQMELFFEQENIVDDNTKNYINEIINGVEDNNSEIEKQIEENIKSDWTLSRISKIDVTLLKLGIYEILYSKLPYKVVINEVVELAKKYAEETSPSFINGILASFVNNGE